MTRAIRLLLAVPATALLAMAGIAYADTQDDQFLKSLSAQGIPGDPGQLIADGHAACANYGTPAFAAQMAGLMGRGLSRAQASRLRTARTRAYCLKGFGRLFVDDREREPPAQTATARRATWTVKTTTPLEK
jgi:hypothetical protein